MGFALAAGLTVIPHNGEIRCLVIWQIAVKDCYLAISIRGPLWTRGGCGDELGRLTEFPLRLVKRAFDPLKVIHQGAAVAFQFREQWLHVAKSPAFGQRSKAARFVRRREPTIKATPDLSPLNSIQKLNTKYPTTPSHQSLRQQQEIKVHLPEALSRMCGNVEKI